MAISRCCAEKLGYNPLSRFSRLEVIRLLFEGEFCVPCAERTRALLWRSRASTVLNDGHRWVLNESNRT